jgi:hypothetical protein
MSNTQSILRPIPASNGETFVIGCMINHIVYPWVFELHLADDEEVLCGHIGQSCDYFIA